MAHNTEKLRELLERCEGASGPDREIDAELDAALFGGRASHSFGRYDGACRLRNSYGLGVVFDHEDPWTNGGHIISGMVRKAEPVTASLDASIALVERMLPGWDWLLSRSDLGGEYSAVVEHWDGDEHVSSRPTAPLAILSALLRALISQAEGEGA